ncbi:hypothetical protein HMPREF0578_1057 [Mobiluncus mulieris 28-1]|nr:hypothetical protein HMPREF0578_1057 [Mobiluncus mulieris 28-1]EFN92275.1 hypothetical protein HMPREF9278_1843 [Mobiluncus mulieris FB024-16]STY85188.1 Uncharacterised protein [Mobiluncus mulieris]
MEENEVASSKWDNPDAMKLKALPNPATIRLETVATFR